MAFKLKDGSGQEHEYGKEKLKIPSTTEGEYEVFTKGEVQAEKTVTITQNGTTEVTPDTGYGSVKKVGLTVDVPEPELQEGQISISANTTTTLTPDEGKAGFSKVDITVDVPSTTVEPLTVTENGTTTAPGGEAYSPVVVNVPTSTPELQEKTVTITSNGTTEVTPDDGKDGLSKVGITTNVQFFALNGKDLKSVVADALEIMSTNTLYRRQGFPIPVQISMQGYAAYTMATLKLDKISSLSDFSVVTPIIENFGEDGGNYTAVARGSYDGTTVTLGGFYAYQWERINEATLDTAFTVNRVYKLTSGGVDLSEGTATEGDVLAGRKFVDSAGTTKEGTMPIRSSADAVNIDNAYFILKEGYYPQGTQLDFPEGMAKLSQYFGDSLLHGMGYLGLLAQGAGPQIFGRPAFPCVVYATLGSNMVGCACTALYFPETHNMRLSGGAIVDSSGTLVQIDIMIPNQSGSELEMTVNTFSVGGTDYKSAVNTSNLGLMYWGGLD